MKKNWLLLVGIALVGCSGNKAVEPEATPPVESARSSISTPSKIPPTDFNAKTELRMVRKGEFLRVGDSVDEALRVFKADKNASQMAEMPPGWKDQNYKSVGWDAGSTGFAVISFDDKTVFAMYHEDRTAEERLQEILNDYDNMLTIPATQLTGTRVRYWFWDTFPHRLMICAVQIPGEGLNVTIALGDAKIMDYMGMNPTKADKDRLEAEELFLKGIEARQEKPAVKK